MGVGHGAKNPTLYKKKIVEKPPRNSAGFCGGGQGLSWAVEPRRRRKKREEGVGGWRRLHNEELHNLYDHYTLLG
jgi:hypothetical protein